MYVCILALRLGHLGQIQTNQLNYNQNRFARSKINENKGAYD